MRTSFLKALYDSLQTNEVLMLDFIYGSIEDNKLHPLDGQQRLTTLFLLHCYASIICNISNKESDLLNNFSYETRMTSRDFCRKLVSNLGNFSEVRLYDQPDGNKVKISHMIEDSSWFFLSWKNLPISTSKP